jgi:hypothetical protein
VQRLEIRSRRRGRERCARPELDEDAGSLRHRRVDASHDERFRPRRSTTLDDARVAPERRRTRVVHATARRRSIVDDVAWHVNESLAFGYGRRMLLRTDRVRAA